jgi:hypothetical protein
MLNERVIPKNEARNYLVLTLFVMSGKGWIIRVKNNDARLLNEDKNM